MSELQALQNYYKNRRNKRFKDLKERAKEFYEKEMLDM